MSNKLRHNKIRCSFFLLNYIHVQLGQKKLNKKLKIQ